MGMNENYTRLESILTRVQSLGNSGETEIITIPTLSNPTTADKIIANKQVINYDNGETITGTLEIQVGGKYDAPLDSALTVCPAGKVLSSEITLRPLVAETWTLKTSSSESSENTIYTYVPLE